MVRGALLRRIEDAPEPSVLVVAPSGFGKTNLIAEWARTTTADVAWLTCKEADSDPTQFWSRLAATLATRWPTLGNDASLLLERPSWEDEELVAAVARDLTDVPVAGAIVLDDCQFAEASQRMLAMLTPRLPPAIRLLMVSQHNPVFSTARLRLEGALAELRAGDLAFTQPEADELFRLAGVDLGPGDRQRLHSLTEGWPAGLQLAVLALRNAEDPRQVLEAFASTTRETSDYLANEVIERLTRDVVEFMTSISVLDEFDAELCEAVSGRADARQLLDRVVANDLFIYQIDYAGERFRFHQMFAAFLRARLKSRGGASFRDAHARAVDALRQRGDRLGALRHAMAVGDVQRAAGLVVESVTGILEVDDAREARGVARAWLAAYGESATENDPDQLLQFVYLLATAGLREAEYWLTALNRTHPNPAPRVDAFAHAVWATYHSNRGTADRALVHNELARKALVVAAAEGPVFPLLAELPMQEAGAHLLAGDLAAAGAALQRDPAPLSSPIVDEFLAPVLQHWIAFLQGDLASARASSDQLFQAAAEHHAVPHGLGLIFANMVAAGISLEDGENERAATLLNKARTGAEINGRNIIQSMVDQHLARLATAQGNHLGAMAHLAQARLVLSAQADSVQAHFVAEELRVAAALAPDLADALISELADDTTTGLLRAKLMVGRRAWAAAAQILDALEPSTIRERVEWGVLRGLTEQERDLARAHALLRDALTLAKPHHYVATIVRQGGGIAALLRSMPTGIVLKDYVDELSKTAEVSNSTPADPAGLAFGQLLTSRELTVLGLLSSRLTTQEIAGTLFVSPNTLKSHMKSIYRKLDVTSRTDAVREGETRGLL